MHIKLLQWLRINDHVCNLPQLMAGNMYSVTTSFPSLIPSPVHPSFLSLIYQIDLENLLWSYLEFLNSNTYTFSVSTSEQEMPFILTYMLLPITVCGIPSLMFILIKLNNHRQWWREKVPWMQTLSLCHSTPEEMFWELRMKPIEGQISLGTVHVGPIFLFLTLYLC